MRIFQLHTKMLEEAHRQSLSVSAPAVILHEECLCFHRNSFSSLPQSRDICIFFSFYLFFPKKDIIFFFWLGIRLMKIIWKNLRFVPSKSGFHFKSASLSRRVDQSTPANFFTSSFHKLKSLFLCV